MLIRKRKTGAVWEEVGGMWVKRGLGRGFSDDTKPVGYMTPFIRVNSRFEVIKCLPYCF